MIKRIVGIILLITGLNLTAQSVKLEYNLKKGDKYSIQMSAMQNMAPIINLNIGVGVKLETTDVQNGNFDFKYQLKDIKMEMSAQGESVSFDSNKNSNDLNEEEKKMKEQITPVLDAIFYQTIDKQGNEISSKMVPEIKQAKALLNQNQFMFVQYPSDAVKVGSKWSDSKSMNGMNMNTSYEVTKITNSKVYATMNADLQGVEKAKASGNIVIDRSSGMLDSMKFNLTANAMGMGVEMKVEMTSKKI